jgi:hypothetical protein
MPNASVRPHSRLRKQPRLRSTSKSYVTAHASQMPIHFWCGVTAGHAQPAANSCKHAGRCVFDFSVGLLILSICFLMWAKSPLSHAGSAMKASICLNGALDGAVWRPGILNHLEHCKSIACASNGCMCLTHTRRRGSGWHVCSDVILTPTTARCHTFTDRLQAHNVARVRPPHPSHQVHRQ